MFWSQWYQFLISRAVFHSSGGARDFLSCCEQGWIMTDADFNMTVFTIIAMVPVCIYEMFSV